MSSLHQGYSSGPYFNYSNPNGSLSTPISRAQHGAPPAQLADGSFARSREEQFTRFFGAPKMPVNFPAAGYNYGHFQLPEAYKGESLMLSEVMIRKITADERFWTRSLAPLVRHEGGMTIHWDRMEFNNHLPTRVPEEGVSRMVSMHKEAEQDSMVRYGMALELEHGFMETEQGRMNFRNNLEQIKNGVVEGTEMGASVKVLNSSNTFDNFYERTGVGLGAPNLDEVLRKETAMYCAPQKCRDGMLTIKDHIKETLQQRGQTGGFVMVVPQGLKAQIDSNESEAIAMINSSANGPRNPVFDKMGLGTVYESRGFYIDSARPTLDIHYTPSYKGEFNYLTFKHLMDLSPEEYRTSYASIQIYDEELDNFVKVDANTSLRKNGLFHWPRGGRDANHNDYKLTGMGSSWFGGNLTWGKFISRHARTYRPVLERYLESTNGGRRSKFRTFVERHYPTVAASSVGQAMNLRTDGGVPGAQRLIRVTNDPVSLMGEPFSTLGELQQSAISAANSFVGRTGIRARMNPADNEGTTFEKRTTASLAAGLAYPLPNLGSAPAFILRAGAWNSDGTPTGIIAGIRAGRDHAPITAVLAKVIADGAPDQLMSRGARDGLVSAFINAWFASGINTKGVVPSRQQVDVMIDALRVQGGAASQQGYLLGQYGAARVLEAVRGVSSLSNGVSDADARVAAQRVVDGMINVGGCVCGNVGATLMDHFAAAASGDMKGLAKSILVILDPDSVQVTEADRTRFIAWFADNRSLYKHWPGFYEADHVPLSIAALRYLVLSTDANKINRLVSWTALCAEMRASALRASTDALREELLEAVQAVISIAAYSTPAFDAMLKLSGIDTVLAAHRGVFGLEVISKKVEAHTNTPAALKSFLAGLFPSSSSVQLHNLSVEISTKYMNDRNQGIPSQVYNAAGVRTPERTNVVNQHSVSAILDLLPIDGRFPEWCIANDVPPPLGSLLLRPHWCHETGVTIGMLPNGRSAYTFFGHPNFEVNDNAVRKVYYGHFTWYSTTVVWNPKGVVRVFDTRSRRYIGGGGTKIYPWNKAGVAAYRGLTSRAAPRFDMFCVPVPANWTPSWWYLDITGRIHPQVTSRKYAQDESQYPQSNMISQIVGFQHGSRAKSYEEKALRRPGSNTICCQGHQVMFNGRKEKIVISQAHWGKNVYPTCGQVRSGRKSMLEPTTHDGTAVMAVRA